MVLFHDITQLKQADKVRRDFVANVSHELRTPLSIVRGYIETLLDNPKTSDKELSRILRVMERHSKRLGLLVDDLLTLAQLESRNTTLQFSDVQLAELFESVIRDWGKQLAEKRLKVAVDLSPDAQTIRADETRLHEVLYNLLDNAVKYSRENGEIHLQAAQHGHEIMLSVTDNGIGISKDDLPRIFERFYRADKARSRELGGTGLGLAIVKHIAQLHGGRVEAESEPGRGTTIRVVLPNSSLDVSENRPLSPGMSAAACHTKVTLKFLTVRRALRQAETMKSLKFGRKILAIALLTGISATASAQLMINGAGATFPYPIYSKWFDEYAKVDPSVRFNYQSIGSGGGQKQILAQNGRFRRIGWADERRESGEGAGQTPAYSNGGGRGCNDVQPPGQSGYKVRWRHNRRNLSRSDHKMERFKANSVESGRKIARSGHRGRTSI